MPATGRRSGEAVGTLDNLSSLLLLLSVSARRNLAQPPLVSSPVSSASSPSSVTIRTRALFFPIFPVAAEMCDSKAGPELLDIILSHRVAHGSRLPRSLAVHWIKFQVTEAKTQAHKWAEPHVKNVRTVNILLPLTRLGLYLLKSRFGELPNISTRPDDDPQMCAPYVTSILNYFRQMEDFIFKLSDFGLATDGSEGEDLKPHQKCHGHRRLCISRISA